MRLGILGPLLVVDDAGREIWVAAARQRNLMAALLVRPNRMVSVDELAELVWDGAPPAGATRTVRSYLARLRHAVGPTVAARIVTHDPGYCCRIAEDELDASRFEALCQEADAALRATDWDRASAAATGALALWRGPLLPDVTSQALREQVGRRFEQLRLRALENRAEARLRLGEHDQLVPELRDLTTQHPLRERFHAHLMLALARSGCRAEALDAYRSARQLLVGELGVEPGPQLRELHQSILADDVAPAPTPVLAVRAEPVVPRQLPAEAGHFTGRVHELRTLSALLERAEPNGGAVVISAIGGTAGVGKTALAVRWAHQVADRFPDGQLYVNLRGYDALEPVSAADALAGFLRALGVDGRDVPAVAAERAALYRSLLSGRRMLVVLDNAAGAHQVRPLLPGTAGCVALVTSRGSLTGLVARDGAVRIELDALTAAEATALLGRLIGPRAHAAPDAVAALAERCCRLPLALRLAAELAAARPATPLPVLADELADRQHRLDALDADGDEGDEVRGVLSWSYRSLDADTARAFRLVALHPGADLDVHAAAAIVGTTVEGAERLLGRLTRAHMVQRQGSTRYAMHDLLRAYARERVVAQETEHDRAAALTCLLDHYLHTALAAMNSLYPTEFRRRPTLAAPNPGLALAPVAEPAAAHAWLDAERANLIAAAGLAADHGQPGHATALAATVERYLSFDHHLTEASAIHGHALRAARHGGDLAAEATALSHLGFIAWIQTSFGPAADLQRQALALFEAAGNNAGQARVLHRLALVERVLGNLDTAAAQAERALRLSQSDGDRLGQARALQSLGITRLAAGRTDEAARHLHQSLTLFDALGDLLGQSVAVKELGLIELRADRLEPAADLFRQALSLCQRTNNPSGQANALSRLGQVHQRQGRHEQATEHQRRALELYRGEIKDRYGEAEVLVRLAVGQLDTGQHQPAMANLEQALRLARDLGTRRLEGEALNGLGDALLAAGRPEQASARYVAALDLAVQTGDLVEQTRSRRGLAATMWPARLPSSREISVPEVSRP